MPRRCTGGARAGQKRQSSISGGIGDEWEWRRGCTLALTRAANVLQAAAGTNAELWKATPTSAFVCASRRGERTQQAALQTTRGGKEASEEGERETRSRLTMVHSSRAARQKGRERALSQRWHSPATVTLQRQRTFSAAGACP